MRGLSVEWAIVGFYGFFRVESVFNGKIAYYLKSESQNKCKLCDILTVLMSITIFYKRKPPTFALMPEDFYTYFILFNSMAISFCRASALIAAASAKSLPFEA